MPSFYADHRSLLSRIRRVRCIPLRAQRLLLLLCKDLVSKSSCLHDRKKQDPEIKFVQQTHEQKGQAVSLNMILDMARKGDYKYWIHWEESWVPMCEFIPNSIYIMNNTSIDQLQLNEAWRDCKTCTLDDANNEFTLVTQKCEEFPEIYSIDKWPLLSLQPSINRIASFDKCSRFTEDAQRWPIQFEYDYGVCLFQSGFVKAVIKPAVCQRIAGHKSTYR